MTEKERLNVIRLSEIKTAEKFPYRNTFRGSNKFGDYIAFFTDENPSKVIFISSTHASFKRVKNAPSQGILEIIPTKSKSTNRIYYMIRTKPLPKLPLEEDNKKP